MKDLQFGELERTFAAKDSLKGSPRRTVRRRWIYFRKVGMRHPHRAFWILDNQSGLSTIKNMDVPKKQG
jgi:hypothetical protein